MNFWNSLIEEATNPDWEMYETMRDSRKSATDSIAMLTPYLLGVAEVDRSARAVFCTRLRNVMESLAVEMFILVCVILLLVIITMQLLLDLQILGLSVVNLSTSCNQSLAQATNIQNWQLTSSVTAQCQYAVTALAIFFLLECSVRIAAGRSGCSRHFITVINLIDATVCTVFCAASVTFTVLTYFRSTGSSASDEAFNIIRDSVSYFVALRLIRMALVVCGATTRVRRELCDALALKRSEYAYLLERTARLERRVAELESKAGTVGPRSIALTFEKRQKGDQSSKLAQVQQKVEPVTVVELHSEHDQRRRGAPTSLSQMALIRADSVAGAHHNGAFELEADADDELDLKHVHNVEQSASTTPADSHSAQRSDSTVDRDGRPLSDTPDAHGIAQVNENATTSPNQTDEDTENGLTPEAEEVIQRLYEVGLEWETEIGDNQVSEIADENAQGSKKRMDESLNEKKHDESEVSNHLSNIPTTNL